MNNELIMAARAIIDRWDCPAWKETEHTGVYIARLRRAVEQAEPVASSQQEQATQDAITTGTGVMKDGKRVAPEDFYVRSVPQDVEEFIESSTRKMKDVDGFIIDAVYTDDLRAWMAGHARVPVDDLETILEVVRGKLNEAYQNAIPVCCRKAGQECCGNPVAEWNQADMELMDTLGPIEKTISAMLTASKEPHNE